VLKGRYGFLGPPAICEAFTCLLFHNSIPWFGITNSLRRSIEWTALTICKPPNERELMNRLASILGVSLVLLTVSASAQIPNASFETWADGSPVNWMATNVPGAYTTITKVSTAHSGSYAARGEVVTVTGSLMMAPILQAGSFGDGFAYTQRPTALTGYYQFFPASGSTDQFLVTVGLSQGVTSVAAGGLKLGASSSYQQFTVPLTYVSAATPDKCFIQFAAGPPSGNPKVGTYFIVDDLAFSTSSTGVAQNNSEVPAGFALEQNYPNPFNPSTAVSYQLPAPSACPPSETYNGRRGAEGSAVSNVKLTVTNTLGQVVATLVDETQAAGRHTVRWDAANMPSGIYYYRLAAGTFSETKKMMLLR
jgi:hypothetical protein